jgi:hypothetical protein
MLQASRNSYSTQKAKFVDLQSEIFIDVERYLWYWYVSNVSIIFDAACLFYTIGFMFCLHFVAFLCEPIDKMLQCQFPVFCYFCVSEKLHRKYSRNWTKRRPKLLFCPEEGWGPNGSRSGARGHPHHQGARPRPWPRPPVVRPPWSTPDDAPSPIRSLRIENPKGDRRFSHNSSAALPPSKTNFGGQKSLFRHPAGMGKCPRSHLHCRLRRFHRPHHHLHHRCCLLWWGGSNSPPGLRALPVAMWFTSLSHDVIFMWSWALYLVELVDAIIQILCYSRPLLL